MAATIARQDDTTQYADPDRVFAEMICAIDESLPGFAEFVALTAQERRERVAPILAAMREAGRVRKCCDGLTVCTCRTGHRCKCEGCNCS